MDYFTTLRLLKEVIKKVPALNYAYGVLGLIAILAITALLKVNYTIAALGGLVVLLLAVMILLFSRLSKISNTHFHIPSLVLLWFSTFLALGVTTLLVTSVFFNTPLELRLDQLAGKNITPKLEDGNPQRVISDHDQQLAKVKAMIENASDEIWMSGTHFQITLYNQLDLIADAILRGVKIYILMYDPEASEMERFAETLRHSNKGLSTEICAAIENITVLQQRVKLKRESTKHQGLIKVGHVVARVYKQIPQGRVYLMDPSSINGEVLTIPYINLQIDTNAPAFLFTSSSNPGQVYVSATKNHWAHSEDVASRLSQGACSKH